MEALPVAALWGVSVVAQKYSLGSVKPATTFIIVTLLHTMFLLGYLTYNWKSFNDDLTNMSRRLSVILLAGVFASFIGNIMYYKTLHTNSAPVVSSVISTVPLFVTLFAFALLGTKLTPKQILGIVIVMIGVSILN
jgi:drug/metabolite transporter, DME family